MVINKRNEKMLYLSLAAQAFFWGDFTALYGSTIMKQDETVQCIRGDSGGPLGGDGAWVGILFGLV